VPKRRQKQAKKKDEDEMQIFEKNSKISESEPNSK